MEEQKDFFFFKLVSIFGHFQSDTILVHIPLAFIKTVVSNVTYCSRERSEV